MFIPCHRIDDPVRSDLFRILCDDPNAGLDPGRDDDRFDVQIFDDPACERMHNIRHNRRDDHILNVLRHNIPVFQYAANIESIFIGSSGTLRVIRNVPFNVSFSNTPNVILVFPTSIVNSIIFQLLSEKEHFVVQFQRFKQLFFCTLQFLNLQYASNLVKCKIVACMFYF